MDFNQIVTDLLPIRWRKLKFLNFLYSLIYPVQTINNEFNEFADNARYLASFNGQVIYLEHILNDLFDISRGIYISDGQVLNKVVIRNKAEIRDVSVLRNKIETEDSIVLRNNQEYQDAVEFIVNVPSSVTLTPEIINNMRGYIDRYRAAGRRYIIINY